MAESPRSAREAPLTRPWLAAWTSDVPPPLGFHWNAIGEEGRRLWVPGDAALAPARAYLGGRSALFDGVLFNDAELARNLDMDADTSHVELVLRAYERWGQEAVTRLRGIFGVVLVESRSGELIAARNGFGTQPLFHTSIDQPLTYFSNSIGLLSKLDPVGRRPNPLTLAGYLSSRWSPDEETFYEDLLRVPINQVLIVDGSGARRQRYWSPQLPERDSEWIRDGAVEAFAEVFAEAVSRRVALGSPGIFLSGGLDSVSVAAFAVAETKLTALSVIFPGPHSEEEIQSGVARALGLEHVLVAFEEAADGKGLLEAALDVGRGEALPWLSFWDPPYALLAERGAEAGCEVILNGNGGDEWLTVDPLYGADLLYRLNLVGFVRHLRRHWRSFTNPRLAMTRNLVWNNGLRPLSISAGVATLKAVSPRLYDLANRKYQARNRSVMPRWVCPDPALDRRMREHIAHTVDLSQRWARPGDQYLDAQRHAHHPFMEYETEVQFEMGRSRGVRLLAPFWDVDVVDFLARVHPDTLSMGGRSKGLVRNTVHHRFPKLGFEKQKKLLAGSFFVRSMATEAPEMYRRIGGVSELAALGVVDRKLFERDVVSRVSEAEDIFVATRLFKALRFELWLRDLP